MSSAEEHSTAQSKKRKVARACDQCRHRKVRCDSSSKADRAPCSNCESSGVQCTFLTQAVKRSPPKGYVEALIDIIHSLAPDLDIDAEVEKRIRAQINAGKRRASSSYIATLKSSIAATPVIGIAPQTVHSVKLEPKAEYESSDDEIGATEIPKDTGLEDNMQRLSLEMTSRFHGKSSGYMLVSAAHFLRTATLGKDERKLQECWFPPKWESDSWEDLPTASTVNFPPPDLAETLFGLYFHHSAPFYPVLIRQQFESQYADGLHLRRSSCAVLVLLVCAIASKYTNDPRVYLEGQGQTSAGWKWFVQVKDLMPSLHAPATMADLQGLVLLAHYASTTTAPHSTWNIVGLAIRFAQDIGIHRRKLYSGPISREEEQWKRIWWCLIVLDRHNSLSLGRSLACNDEDFDVDMPEEVDDEYWDNPIPLGSPSSTRQPSNVPSNIAFFNCYIRLGQIMSFALRTLYTINKSKALLRFSGPQWEKNIIAELDGAMARWLELIPDHLRWNPKRENQIHFQQSAYLYAIYYALYILIYRPFTASPLKEGGWKPLPSFSLCLSAARACTGVLDALQRRCEILSQGSYISSFTSGIVILMGLWGARKSGSAIDEARDRADIQACLRFLKRVEPTFSASRKLYDVLYNISPFEEDGNATSAEFANLSTDMSTARSNSTSVTQLSTPVDVPVFLFAHEAYPVSIQPPTIALSGGDLQSSLSSPEASTSQGPNIALSSKAQMTSTFWDWPSMTGVIDPMLGQAEDGASASGSSQMPSGMPQFSFFDDLTSAGTGLDEDPSAFWERASQGFEWEKWSESLMSLDGLQFPLPPSMDQQ